MRELASRNKLASAWHSVVHDCLLVSTCVNTCVYINTHTCTHTYTGTSKQGLKMANTANRILIFTPFPYDLGTAFFSCLYLEWESYPSGEDTLPSNITKAQETVSLNSVFQATVCSLEQIKTNFGCLLSLICFLMVTDSFTVQTTGREWCLLKYVSCLTWFHFLSVIFSQNRVVI